MASLSNGSSQTAEVRRKSVSNDDYDYSHCDAVIATSIELGDESSMRRTAADALSGEATAENLFVEDFRGKCLVTNASATSFIEDAMAAEESRDRHEELRKRFDRLELDHQAELSDVHVELSNVRAEFSNVQAQLSSLKQSQTAYADIRHRFLSVYKRDKLGIHNDNDRNYISSGNISAHGGDVRFDAQLYVGPSARRDFYVFESLYGINPLIVPSITYSQIFTLLDTHASIISSKYKATGNNFQTSFKKFVDELKVSEFVDDYLSDRSKEVTNAHLAFLRFAQTDVTDLPSDN